MSLFRISSTYILIFFALFHIISAKPTGSAEQSNLEGKNDILNKMSTMNDYKGWHTNAIENPHRSPEEFVPDINHLSFTLLSNTPVEPEGFTLAVFKPTLPDSSKPNSDDSTIVDALGRVLYIPQDTYTYLNHLASEISATLPETGTFRNTWRIKHPTTSRPIDRLLFKSDTDGLKETSVQGFSADKTELVSPVGKYTHLPKIMRQFFGLALEAREDYSAGNADKEMIGKVKKALGVE
jgi:hypothetical protein